MGKLQSFFSSSTGQSRVKRRSRVLSAAGTAGIFLIPLATYALYNPAGSGSEPPSGPQVKNQSTLKADSASNTSGSSAPSEGSSQSHNSSTTQVTVNGQIIPVPENGSVHQTVPTPDGTGSTNVDINSSLSDSNTTVTTNGNGSTSVNIDSSSQSSGSGYTSSSSSTFISNQSFTNNFNSP
jgi:hypothetical protein